MTTLTIELDATEAMALGVIGMTTDTPGFQGFARKALHAIEVRPHDAETISVVGVTFMEALAVAFACLPFSGIPIVEAVAARMEAAMDAAGIAA